MEIQISSIWNTNRFNIFFLKPEFIYKNEAQVSALWIRGTILDISYKLWAVLTDGNLVKSSRASCRPQKLAEPVSDQQWRCWAEIFNTAKLYPKRENIPAQKVFKEEFVPVRTVLPRKLQPRLISHWSRDYRWLGQKKRVCSEWQKTSPVAFLLPTSLVSLSEGLKHDEHDKKWGGTTN